MLRSVRTVALGAAVFVVSALPAFAHAHLVSAVPPAGGVVATAPLLLQLHFTERVEPAFTGVVLKATSGSTVPTGPTTLDPADPTTITAAVSTALGAGRYEVDWHALATDGHKTSGSYTFAIQP